MPPDGEVDTSPEEFDSSWILFHGAGLLVIDKPARVPVHRGTGHDRGVVELLAEWVRQHPGVLDLRAGGRIHPVNLVDLEASGVLVIGLTRSAARAAKESFAARAVEKTYLAVVAGPVDERGTIRGVVPSRLRGRRRDFSVGLSYRRLQGDERLSLVEIELRESRTHHVRRLLRQADRPLAGDLRYGRRGPARKFLARFSLSGPLLHLRRLVLPQSVLGAERAFEAPVPGAFRRLCEAKGWDQPVAG